MCSKGFIRRVLPFFATFAVGIFIASFFVNVGMSRFRGRGWERHQQNERLRMENDQLRIENQQLHDQLESVEGMHHRLDRVKTIDLTTGEETEITLPFDAQMQPPLPNAPRHPMHDK
ncbi:MAG: hypothetical protein ABIP78_02660 [Pyrinomonadaceae bacterium]